MTTRSGEYSIVKCPEHHVADTCHTILGRIKTIETKNKTKILIKSNLNIKVMSTSNASRTEHGLKIA